MSDMDALFLSKVLVGESLFFFPATSLSLNNDLLGSVPDWPAVPVALVILCTGANIPTAHPY